MNSLVIMGVSPMDGRTNLPMITTIVARLTPTENCKGLAALG